MDWMTPSSSLFLARTTKAPLARGFDVSGLRQPSTKTLSCFSLILLWANTRQQSGCEGVGACCVLGAVVVAYLMAGGAPAGINILPGELGCLTNKTKMRMTTMQGNSMTTPRGMEMVEFPLRRSGRRKKARRDHNLPCVVLCFCSFSSAVGSRGPEGMILEARRIRSMVNLSREWSREVSK